MERGKCRRGSLNLPMNVYLLQYFYCSWLRTGTHARTNIHRHTHTHTESKARAHTHTHTRFLSTTELKIRYNHIILQGCCRLSDVSNYKHGIISKRFELEGWNLLWCFIMTWQARFSSRIKIEPPLPPYHPPKQGQKANFCNFGLMSMKFCMEVTFGGIQLKRNT